MLVKYATLWLFTLPLSPCNLYVLFTSRFQLIYPDDIAFLFYRVHNVVFNACDFCEAQQILPEGQCGFRPAGSTIDMLFVVRRLQELGRQRKISLYMCFVDLHKAYDWVDRELFVVEGAGPGRRTVRDDRRHPPIP